VDDQLAEDILVLLKGIEASRSYPDKLGYKARLTGWSGKGARASLTSKPIEPVRMSVGGPHRCSIRKWKSLGTMRKRMKPGEQSLPRSCKFC
jgi:hypothetical protein